MVIKIGNTILVDDILNVNFEKCKLGEQIMSITSYDADIMINDETETREINEYISYFINNVKYNNSLINLNFTKLETSFEREYEDDCENDRLYSNINIEKDNQSIAILNIDGKNYAFQDSVLPEEEINDNKSYDSFIVKAKEKIDLYSSLSKNVNLFDHKVENEFGSCYYHYLTMKVSKDLCFIFCIYYNVEFDSLFFSSGKICAVIDSDGKFEFLNNGEFYTLFDFLVKNKKYNILYESIEKENIKNFEHKLNIFKYSLFDIITSESKLINLLSLFNYDISKVEFQEKLKPVYQNEKFKLKIYALPNNKFNSGHYTIMIDNKETSICSIDDKNIKKMCNGIISYMCKNERSINVFTGEIENDHFVLLYKDATGMIFESKNVYVTRYFYKKIEDCYIRIEDRYYDSDNKIFIKEIEERYKLKETLEEANEN